MRNKGHAIDQVLDEQFATGRLYACISSRPGQCGRCDGYILEGKELEFYVSFLSISWFVDPWHLRLWWPSCAAGVHTPVFGGWLEDNSRRRRLFTNTLHRLCWVARWQATWASLLTGFPSFTHAGQEAAAQEEQAVDVGSALRVCCMHHIHWLCRATDTGCAATCKHWWRLEPGLFTLHHSLRHPRLIAPPPPSATDWC